MSFSTNSNAAQVANNGITTADQSDERSAHIAIYVFVRVFLALILLDFHDTFPGEMSNTCWQYPDLQQKRAPYRQA